VWSCEGGTGLRRHELEEGVLGSARTDRPPACSGRARASRCAAFIGGRGSETRHLNSQHGADLGRRAQQGLGDGPLGGALLAVQRGTEMLSCSKDGRREGDHDPYLEAMGSVPHGRRGGRDSLSTARGAVHTGRAPDAPAALWSAAELFFSRSTRL
jgi:hypothetical protein